MVAQSKIGSQGTLSASITKNQLAYIEGNSWIGEEAALLDLPVIYDVIASSPTVRVFRISVADFKQRIPADVQNLLEESLWQRMNYLRDRLLTIHETRTEIVRLDKMA